MKAFVDKKGCISCGLCVSICPTMFFIDEDGRAAALMTDVPEGSIENAEKAQEACPRSVVKLEY